MKLQETFELQQFDVIFKMKYMLQNVSINNHCFPCCFSPDINCKIYREGTNEEGSQ